MFVGWRCRIVTANLTLKERENVLCDVYIAISCFGRHSAFIVTIVLLGFTIITLQKCLSHKA